MNNAILFKALQRHFKFRNPDSKTDFGFDSKSLLSGEEIISAEKYIAELIKKEIRYTYPGELNYPAAFYKMIEPPLFLEYIGDPVWMTHQIFSIVGSRKIHSFTERWLNSEIPLFLQNKPDVAIASGGAFGVDQCAHWIAVKSERPTVVILPCGVENLFPQNLNTLKKHVLATGGCFLSEFESHQDVRKHFFFFRNRLIAAIANITMVAQAEKRSGSFLTVHHALNNGKILITLPAHPMMTEFSGNQQLLSDGCHFVLTNKDLLNIWDSEFWSGRGLTLDVGCI